MKNAAGGDADSQRHARLADFIRQSEPAIVKEWTDFALTRKPASDSMSKLALQDHITDILKFIADDLDNPQTSNERFDKSRGFGPEGGPFHHSAAEVHAALRLADGFDIDQMVSEYRALRASVVKQWVAHNTTLQGTDIEDLTRFNEAIDQAVTESVAHYTKTINDSRNLFLGVLGHDLRNPIGAASMGAKMLLRSDITAAKHEKVASEIVRTTGRATQILDDLLDLARTSFGTDIPVAKAEMDIGPLCLQLAEELRAIRGGRLIEIKTIGNTKGSWDKSRIGQVLSNLMANSVQHGDASSPVFVTVDGNDPGLVRVSVHNWGRPIAPEKIKTIFHSWTRGQIADAPTEAGTHLGLGLYIAKLIVSAHGGQIGVASDETNGTLFSVDLPRS